MYLMCPSGLMQVFYSAIADEKYLSQYWTEKDGQKIFKYTWEDATFLYFIRKEGFLKHVTLNILTHADTFQFAVQSIEKVEDPETGLLEMITFNVIDTRNSKPGSFFLLMYDKEKEIYRMNHLPRSDALNDD